MSDIEPTTGLVRHLVAPAFACPECGERDADLLLWDENGELVECEVCGCIYDPLSPAGE